MPIFKAYDIRGTYPDEVNEAIAEKIGMAIGAIIEGKTIVVGRDMRLAAPQIQKAIISGLLRAGKDVVNIGQVTSPMVTFAVAQFGYDGGVQVTASHNPSEYIGAKLCRAHAAPVSYETGIGEIERRVLEDDLPEAAQPGSASDREVLPEYLDHVMTQAAGIQGIKVVIDAGNGMAGYLMPPLFERLDAELVPLYFELDGSFPNHEANPLKPENVVDLQKKVVDTGAALGVAFDGDADRVAFIDEKGNAIACDIIVALIAREVLANEPGATILYDLRSSWAVKEEIEACGGVPVETRVGHSYIKAAMKEHGAAFGGELSGHYYYRENFNCDSGAFTLVKVLALLCREGKPLGELVAPLLRYHGSGEINSEVPDKEGKIEELAHFYDSGHASHLDGLKVTYDDWWFNVRPSNTEPALRLVVEARTPERMEAMRDHLLEHIRRPYSVRRILFPTDFSDYSLNALGYAIGLAEDYSSEMHILHVVPAPDWAVQFEQVAPVLDAEFFDQMEQSAAESIDSLAAERVRDRLEVTTAVRRGTAFLEIVRYAKEQDIDLIVIATHGRTGLKHALFGSVAEKVVRKAPCPVLSVRPEGHEYEAL
ncbi:universal stress protein [bacterium]|nr:universal stress protein [bacterium]